MSGSADDGTATTAATELAAFTGVGTFNVDLASGGDLLLSASGGNIDTSQSTSSSALFTVVYFIEEATTVTVPAPGTIALLGLGLLVMRVRKRA